MESLTTAMMALGTVIASKALEKISENVGEVLWKKTTCFMTSLRKQSPETVVTIEKAQEQSIDYNKVILEIDSAAKANFEVAQSMQELATFSETNPLPDLPKVLREIQKSVKQSHHTYPETFIQNIEKAINAAQTQTIDQSNSTFNI